jgi:hypothetical protein
MSVIWTTRAIGREKYQIFFDRNNNQLEMKRNFYLNQISSF